VSRVDPAEAIDKPFEGRQEVQQGPLAFKDSGDIPSKWIGQYHRQQERENHADHFSIHEQGVKIFRVLSARKAGIRKQQWKE
jgi:hypothetical protein